MRVCNILGVNICVTNLSETVGMIESSLNELKGKYICVSNVHTTVMSHEEDAYKKIQNESFVALPDGKPLSIVSKLRGYKEAERVTGPDLMKEIFEVSEKKGYKHYFYGSTNETLDKLMKELELEYPKLNVVGYHSPPFRPLSEEEDSEIISQINNINPDFIWVGLGAPKQEIWMSDHAGKINSLMIGVGAGFDYFAKNIKRAPRWMQKFSLEWMYRLMQDPKRLWKRYLVYNTKFIILVIKEHIKKK